MMLTFCKILNHFQIELLQKQKIKFLKNSRKNNFFKNYYF